MRKTLLIVVGVSLSCILLAQETFPVGADGHKHDKHDHKGRLFTGGAITYWYNTEDKSTKFEFHPEIGYLFNDTWGMGLFLGYGYESEKHEDIRSITNSIKFSPFVRYYYFHREPFNLYFDGGVGFNISGYREGDIRQIRKGFEVGIRPGVCVDLTKGLCLCLRLGFLGYRNSYFAGEEEGIGNDGFGIRFSPEELMIGLELEF